MQEQTIKEIGESIKRGEIGIIPTDTIYGIVCSALSKQSVEKLYKIRKRNKKKPVIVLIGSVNDLKLFNVSIPKKIINNYWPGRVSIIMDCENFEYIHRGKKSIAFRLPKNENLVKILKISGPIIAPSANIEGEEPAKNITEAKKYFGDKVNFYLDTGELKSKPSKIISLDEEIIRK